MAAIGHVGIRPRIVGSVAAQAPADMSGTAVSIIMTARHRRGPDINSTWTNIDTRRPTPVGALFPASVPVANHAGLLHQALRLHMLRGAWHCGGRHNLSCNGHKGACRCHYHAANAFHLVSLSLRGFRSQPLFRCGQRTFVVSTGSEHLALFHINAVISPVCMHI